MEPSASYKPSEPAESTPPPPHGKTLKRQRLFKRAIVALTMLVAMLLIAVFPEGRYRLRLGTMKARDTLARTLIGLEPDRAKIDAEWSLRRARGIEEVRRSLTSFYNGAGDEMRQLFQMAEMDPAHAMIRYGRGDQAFVISPGVFEPDQHGRSYRFRPSTRSVWLRQITIRNGPFAMFQVKDTPENRAIAGRSGAIVDEGSVQNTNSWGVRGPEPSLNADVRGVVLGDSFMQAMFNSDDDTPSLYLERFLKDAWKLSVSVLNTGHIGYSPEQYYYTLVEYGEKFRPHFVVVSLCPNDFGDGGAVMNGQADWLSEAQHWMDEIHQWCAARSVICMVVGVPVHTQIEAVRRDDLYPAIVARAYRGPGARYCFPLEEFFDEHLRLAGLLGEKSDARANCLLYNRAIHDDHFSPRGAALWGKIVGRRLLRLYELASPESTRPAGTPESPFRAPAALSPPK